MTRSIYDSFSHDYRSWCCRSAVYGTWIANQCFVWTIIFNLVPRARSFPLQTWAWPAITARDLFYVGGARIMPCEKLERSKKTLQNVNSMSGSSSKPKEKKGLSALGKSYLLLYNGVLTAGWAWVFLSDRIRTLSAAIMIFHLYITILCSGCIVETCAI